MDDVLIIGAGPVGLTLATALCRHGTSCRIVDQLAQPLPYCRAIGVTPRTLEVWEDMGVNREMIDAGLWLTGQRSVINGQAHDAIEFYAGLPYGMLGIPQDATERVLTHHLGQCGVEVERGITITSLEETADGISVHFTRADGTQGSSMSRYVVGCDGAHSIVRRALGIAFTGDSMPMSFMLGDVHIGWDLPRGMSFRALNLVENAAPDMFIAIPLPEPNRYRVSMFAEPDMQTAGGTEHGIQSVSSGPGLAHLQTVANRLLPGQPVLSDLRWSSIFRISMRLAAQYRRGRAFLAGDAAHIHPPTGGQGMNTGIQDAYNLAWKLALVLQNAAPEVLLDSYELERRPVGAEVVARTTAATRNYGREPGQKLDRLADTQICVSYRGTDYVRDDAESLDTGSLAAGDRAPDAGSLRRAGIGFPLRLFDIIRGTAHVLVIHQTQVPADIEALAGFAAQLRDWLGSRLRIAVITAGDNPPEYPGLAFFYDCEGSFKNAYGAAQASFLMRPDGHIGWRGRDWQTSGLMAYLERTFEPK
jgi:2-polyprenyl-6-methoxyphenol hydroxylase-like FAD-dependent oxidoreductase